MVYSDFAYDGWYWEDPDTFLLSDLFTFDLAFDDIVVTAFSWDFWTEANLEDARDYFGINTDSIDIDQPSALPSLLEAVLDRANKLADQAVVRGAGFDPNNPRHIAMEQKVKEAVKQMSIKGSDGEVAGMKLSNGANFTDAKLLDIALKVKIELTTDNLTGGNAARYFHNGENPLIVIDIDNPTIGILENNFGSLNEAVNFVVLHEFGHAIDQFFGNGIATGPSEAEANRYALDMLELLRMERPTEQEVRDSGYTIEGSGGGGAGSADAGISYVSYDGTSYANYDATENYEVLDPYMWF